MAFQQSQTVAIPGISFANNADDRGAVAPEDRWPAAARLVPDPGTRIGVGRIKGVPLAAHERDGKTIHHQARLDVEGANGVARFGLHRDGVASPGMWFLDEKGT